MGAFEDAVADILNDEDVSNPATFTPANGGSDVETRALIARNLELTDTYGSVVEIDISITMPQKDVGLPEKGAEVDLDGTRFLVQRVVTYDEYTVNVSCKHG